MKKSQEKDIVLAVGAHPDDIDFAASGTIAKWILDGAVCYYLILTDGSKGSNDPTMTSRKLVKIRRQEQLAAAAILGVEKVFFLNHVDTELVPDLALKEEITQKIRDLRPTKVVTINPQIIFSLERNFINHTDHRAAGLATIDSVFPLARDRLTFPEHESKGLKTHKVKELYLTSFGEGNYISDIEKTLDLKIKAIQAHTSQTDAKIVERIKYWAAQNGQKANCKYAEIFIKIELP